MCNTKMISTELNDPSNSLHASSNPFEISRAYAEMEM